VTALRSLAGLLRPWTAFYRAVFTFAPSCMLLPSRDVHPLRPEHRCKIERRVKIELHLLPPVLQRMDDVPPVTFPALITVRRPHAAHVPALMHLRPSRATNPPDKPAGR
jgi:hypothetical protein